MIRVAKWLGQMSCVGEYLVYSDTRLNIMHMDEVNAEKDNEKKIIKAEDCIMGAKRDKNKFKD